MPADPDPYELDPHVDMTLKEFRDSQSWFIKQREENRAKAKAKREEAKAVAEAEAAKEMAEAEKAAIYELVRKEGISARPDLRTSVLSCPRHESPNRTKLHRPYRCVYGRTAKFDCSQPIVRALSKWRPQWPV